MAKELKIGTAEEREALAEQALTDEDIVDALAQEIAGSSRIRRQKAAATVALIADKDASVLLPFSDDIASGLTKPEAQTRWEVLHALDKMGKAGQRYDEDVLVAAEDSLYDETNGFVREAAFHFFCGYGSASSTIPRKSGRRLTRPSSAITATPSSPTCSCSSSHLPRETSRSPPVPRSRSA